MTIDRALEIIAAHGADARRWPADERAAVLALAADPQVAAALAEARDLDAMLADWAVAPAMGTIDLAAITRQPQQQAMPQTASRGWILGGAMAAAIAGVIALAPARDTTSTQIASISSFSNATVPSATVQGGPTGSDAEAFAYVFTPTADEDDLI